MSDEFDARDGWWVREEGDVWRFRPVPWDQLIEHAFRPAIQQVVDRWPGETFKATVWREA